MPDAKATLKKASKPKAKSSHTPTAAKIKAAIKALKERNGSSLLAIKKYITANYKVDVVKLVPFIKKALKSMTEKGVLFQTKGTSTSGSFKLTPRAKDKKPMRKAALKKKLTKKTSPKKKAVKKPAGEKKAKKAASPKKKATKKSPGEKKAKKAASPKKKPAAKKPTAKKPAAKKPAAKNAPKKHAKK